MTMSLFHFRPAARRPGPLRSLGLRAERIRLERRIRDLRALLDMPHDLADAAQIRIGRLGRPARALRRLLG